MVRKLIRNLNKHKYLRVITFNNDKSSEVNYYKSKNFKAPFLINPNHIFLWNGFRTVITTNIATETINPLDFESKYETSHFKTAIESKLVNEAFTTLKPKLDPITILLVLNIVFSFAIIYLVLKGQGVV